MNILKIILLFPFTTIYGTIIFLRNRFYDWNIFKFHEFKTLTISVGNLSVGGTGKTPHVEYLIQLLSNNYKVSTLSRGYKRKTSGFIIVNDSHNATDVGDEPLQYYKKFKPIIVSVDEKRVNGIQNLEKNNPEIDLILLDDAFQHRSVKPGKSILITEYNNLYINDLLLPAGRLREWKCGAKRANIIIVSKCPINSSSEDQEKVIQLLKLKPYQKVLFSFIKYGTPLPFMDNQRKLISNETTVLAFTGIGNFKPLLNHLKESYNLVKHISFTDHYQYTTEDVLNIKSQFNKIRADNKIIITTEKDIMRLYLPELKNELKDIPVFYIPITIDFLGNGKEEFDKEILDYVRANS